MIPLPKVYLAGPIKGLNYDGATQWRESATAILAVQGIAAYSPMRGKDYLKGATTVGQDDLLKDSYDQFPLSTNKAILCRDYHDCTTSDAVLINMLGAERVSIGTVLEVAWAHAARVPIVLVMEPTGNVHEHGLMVEACNFRVATLDEAIKVICAVLLP